MAFRPLAMALADLLCPWDELRWRGNDLLCPSDDLLCPSDDLLWRGNELLWFWTTCHAFRTVCYGFSSTCCLFRRSKRDTWPSRAGPRRASRRARCMNWASDIMPLQNLFQFRLQFNYFKAAFLWMNPIIFPADYHIMLIVLTIGQVGLKSA